MLYPYFQKQHVLRNIVGYKGVIFKNFFLYFRGLCLLEFLILKDYAPLLNNNILRCLIIYLKSKNTNNNKFLLVV